MQVGAKRTKAHQYMVLGMTGSAQSKPSIILIFINRLGIRISYHLVVLVI